MIVNVFEFRSFSIEQVVDDVVVCVQFVRSVLVVIVLIVFESVQLCGMYFAHVDWSNIVEIFYVNKPVSTCIIAAAVTDPSACIIWRFMQYSIC
jgi:hypothetical protein